MKIRLATVADIDSLLALGQIMHQESRFKVFPMNRVKTRHMAEALINNPKTACILLAEHDTAGLIGMLGGHVADYFFCDAVVAQDNFFFVLPAHRGSAAALKLLIAFRRWAENRRAAELCINMSVNVDRQRFDQFMQHLQFTQSGSNFYLPLTSKISA